MNKPTSSSDYPFMLSIISGSPSLVSHLLDSGAEQNVTDKFGNSPMHLAMADGNRSIVMILIQKKFKVHLLNRQGLTPLLCAVINGHRFSCFFLNRKLLLTSIFCSASVKLLCNYDVSVLGACTFQVPFSN